MQINWKHSKTFTNFCQNQYKEKTFSQKFNGKKIKDNIRYEKHNFEYQNKINSSFLIYLFIHNYF